MSVPAQEVFARILGTSNKWPATASENRKNMFQDTCWNCLEGLFCSRGVPKDMSIRGLSLAYRKRSPFSRVIGNCNKWLGLSAIKYHFLRLPPLSCWPPMTLHILLGRLIFRFSLFGGSLLDDEGLLSTGDVSSPAQKRFVCRWGPCLGIVT